MEYTKARRINRRNKVSQRKAKVNGQSYVSTKAGREATKRAEAAGLFRAFNPKS